MAFDLTAACSGFVLAMITGTQYIRTGAVKNVLVVGADALSRFVDWRDRCEWGSAEQHFWLRMDSGPGVHRMLVPNDKQFRRSTLFRWLTRGKDGIAALQQ